MSHPIESAAMAVGSGLSFIVSIMEVPAERAVSTIASCACSLM